jgi:hypothetical protein
MQPIVTHVISQPADAASLSVSERLAVSLWCATFSLHRSFHRKLDLHEEKPLYRFVHCYNSLISLGLLTRLSELCRAHLRNVL